MANFVSSLTGTQLDSALSQVEQRVPEGWAVGEREGIPVSSSSPYYHNNAKYYADYAQGQAERAEAAVPAGTAGAVFFDRAQALTTAQQEQAKANISAGSTNPNLLDNPWFTVNQRGASTGLSGNGSYVADRWITTFGNTPGVVNHINDGIEITPGASSWQGIRQRLDDVAFLNGKQITVSFMLSNGNIYSGTITRVAGTEQVIINSTELLMVIVINASNDLIIRVFNGAQTVILKAVKLELGSYSTLANDAPPNYQQELAKCQRYFLRLSADTAYGMFGMGIVNNAGGTSAWVMLNLPVSMRRFPDTMTYGGSFRTLAGVNGALVTGTVSTMSISTNAGNRNVARIDILGTGFGQFGTPFMLGANNDASAHIDLSADL